MLCSLRRNFDAWRFSFSSAAAADSRVWCSSACTCCSSSRLRCLSDSAPLVRAQSLSSRPSTRRVSDCVSSMRPLTLPWTSAHFSRLSFAAPRSSSFASSLRSRTVSRRRSSAHWICKHCMEALTFSAKALTWFCTTTRDTPADSLADADATGAAPRSPGSRVLCGLLQIEVFTLASPPPDSGGSRSRSKCWIRRTSSANALRAGLADLTRL
mmetsp:Transcript_44814/g.135920  ORF Transcript_44814/g.135920 Transcript_44814/m.135920 type:complete len:212 (+) Transcript_44814:1730-2365(+)